MNTEENKVSRRKLLGWIGVVSLFASAGAAFRPWANRKKPKTVKMLTQDGKLVEVDASALASTRTRISDHGLRSWINRKP